MCMYDVSLRPYPAPSGLPATQLVMRNHPAIDYLSYTPTYSSIITTIMAPNDNSSDLAELLTTTEIFSTKAARSESHGSDWG